MAQDGWNRDQGAAGCQQSDRTTLCANNCGFFGSASTLHMCSQCYTAHIAKTMETAAAAGSSVVAAAAATVAAAGSQSPSFAAQARQVVPSPSSVAVVMADSDPIAPAVSTRLTDSTTSRVHGGVAASSSSTHSSLPSFPSPAVPGAARSPVCGATTAAAAAAAGPACSCSSSLHGSCRPVTRCAQCSRRVGLTGFKCRCDGVFCSAHRYSDRHECSFDYKSAGRAAIAKANPIVKAEKVDRF